MANEIQPINTSEGEIVLYQPDENISLEVKLDAAHETVWLTQQQIADLFGVKQPAISKHLNNIFKSGELDPASVHSILEYTAADYHPYHLQQEVQRCPRSTQQSAAAYPVNPTAP